MYCKVGQVLLQSGAAFLYYKAGRWRYIERQEIQSELKKFF